MKISKKVTFAIATMIFVFCLSPITANNKIDDDIIHIISSADVIGSWDYTADGVDSNYSKGVMHITNEAGKHVIKIYTGDIMMTSEEININGNEVNFVVYADQDRIEVALVMDGDSFSGQGTASQGPFSLQGTRRAEPQ